MLNNIMEMNHDKCTSCGICEAVCPVNAIEIKLNEDGFYQPVLNQEKCINCGICKKTCIKFNYVEEKMNVLEVYSAKNKSKEILKQSSSGGVSYELMKKCIEKGYMVVGVEYDYNQDISITSIEKDINKLYKFFGSKYMQSYTVDALKDIIKNSKKDKYAIFGLPCQIFSLRKFAELHNLEENFIFIDLFCHGCPSLNLWKKYIEEKKEKLNCEKFDFIEFRSKIYGWHEQSLNFIKNDRNIPSKKINDEFFEIFFDNNAFNRSCYGCDIRMQFGYSDIRLGDFWGRIYDEDLEGVSAIVISTEKGKKFFEEIKNKFILKDHDVKEVLSSQSCSKKHIENIEKRRKILELLESNLKIEKISEKCRSWYPLKKKVRKYIINFIKENFSKEFIKKLRKLSH